MVRGNCFTVDLRSALELDFAAGMCVLGRTRGSEEESTSDSQTRLGVACDRLAIYGTHVPGSSVVGCRADRGGRVKDRIEVGVVVHFHLPVKLEASFTAADLIPEFGEASGEVLRLDGKDGKALLIAFDVRRFGVGSDRFFFRVEEFERQDGEPVEDEAGCL